VDMFVRQAAHQFELFIGQQPDRAIMRGIVRKALSPLTKAIEATNVEAVAKEPMP
jgi:3-dehydroquinate dehydratase / shikimate dehydrogenase